jgi:ribosomal protein L12E/L44/L45/RPP1/RPP2
MKKSLLLTLLVATLPAQAGTVEPASGSPEKPRHSFLDPVGDFVRDSILDPKTPFELVPGKNPEDWTFVLEPYVWALGLNGNIGVKGLPSAHIGFSSRTILQHLQWGIFMQGEIRKGRWGVLADGYYAALTASASPDNRIYDNVNLGLQQSIVSLALAYRVIDDRRGFLDLYAGVRYNYLGLQVDASLNDSRISEIGTNSANAISSRVDARLDTALSEILAQAQQTAATAANSAANAVIGSFRTRDIEKLILRDRDLRKLVRDDVIVRSLAGTDVRKALASYIRAAAAASASRAQGVTNTSLEAAAAAEKKKLAKAISNKIEDVTPTYAAGDQYWFDPIIGLRGQVNFTRWLYLAAQGDVGGFGAGSQIAWNVQAALGVNFTRNIFAELGYRYMYVDYENNGFLYNMNSYGLYSSIGVKF